MNTHTATGLYRAGDVTWSVRVLGKRGGFTYITFLDGRNRGTSTKVPSSWVEEVF